MDDNKEKIIYIAEELKPPGYTHVHCSGCSCAKDWLFFDEALYEDEAVIRAEDRHEATGNPTRVLRRATVTRDELVWNRAKQSR